MVDNQNINARYIDKFSQGTTSVKLHAPPGGKSTFSLGWGNDTNTDDYKKNNSYQVYNNKGTGKENIVKEEPKTFKSLGGGKSSNQENNLNQGNNFTIHQNDKPSVRVKNPPGGQSSIKFG